MTRRSEIDAKLQAIYDQIRAAEHGTTIPPEVARRRKLKPQR